MEIKLATHEAQYTIDHLTTNLMKGRYNVYGALHSHPVFHIMYVLEGKGKFTVGSTTTTALPGMLYIINPNEPHKFVFGYEEPFTNLESTFQLLDASGNAADVNFFDLTRNSRNSTLDTTQPFLVPSRLKPLLIEGYERILGLYASPLLRHHFGLMVADLLTRVETIVYSSVKAEQTGTREDETIETIKHFLHSNRGRPVTLRETAEFAHLTPNYLCRLFKEHSGETPMGYLQGVRMREAESLLSLTDLPVYAISEKLGYEEPSYFARVFRSVYGESPQLYRKRLQGENRIK